MHPDVIAFWAKTKGWGHLFTLDTCLVCSIFVLFLEDEQCPEEGETKKTSGKKLVIKYTVHFLT